MTVSQDYLIERVLYRLNLTKDKMCPVTLHNGNTVTCIHRYAFTFLYFRK